MKSIKMTALKSFRLPDGQGFRWVSPGDEYTVDTVSQKKYHEETGRGVAASSKAKKGD